MQQSTSAANQHTNAGHRNDAHSPVATIDIVPAKGSQTHLTVSVATTVGNRLDMLKFRFNRRSTPMAAFQTLLGLQSQQQPTTYDQIIASSTDSPSTDLN